MEHSNSLSRCDPAVFGLGAGIGGAGQLGPNARPALRPDVLACYLPVGQGFKLRAVLGVEPSLAVAIKADGLRADTESPCHPCRPATEFNRSRDLSDNRLNLICTHDVNSTLVEAALSTGVVAYLRDQKYGARMSLGLQIKKYREAARLTYGELEELSGVGTASLNALEKRQSKRSEHAPAIAKAFGLTLDQLLDESTDHSERVRQHISRLSQGCEAKAIASEPDQAGDWPFNVGRDRVSKALTSEDLSRVNAYILALVQARETDASTNHR